MNHLRCSIQSLPKRHNAATEVLNVSVSTLSLRCNCADVSRYARKQAIAHASKHCIDPAHHLLNRVTDQFNLDACNPVVCIVSQIIRRI